jgi:hypothetical protein
MHRSFSAELGAPLPPSSPNKVARREKEESRRGLMKGSVEAKLHSPSHSSRHTQHFAECWTGWTPTRNSPHNLTLNDLLPPFAFVGSWGQKAMGANSTTAVPFAWNGIPFLSLCLLWIKLRLGERSL